MSSIERIVIVGAGLAGARAAETLRKEGYEGEVLLFGDERERPYLRPPLTKAYLRGEEGLDKVYVHPDGFYETQRIELRTGSAVTGIDVRARTVGLADGSSVAYDRLLLATGAEPRRLEVPGSDLAGVHHLRTLADADAIQRAAADATDVVVVGGGWLGSEAAASLRSLGHEVTLLSRDRVPLERVLGPEVGAIYRDLHAAHGVSIRPRTDVARVLGTTRVEAVETSDGERIACDLVVVGIGARPRADLAAAAGLKVENGIAVDETLETSTPGVFAAGDVAQAWHPFYDRALRVEHWANARFQGLAAARSMLGNPSPYARIPYFYSDQYDLGMEYTGLASGSDRVVFRGDPARGEFLAFWLDDGGRVAAGMNANSWGIAKKIEVLVRSRAAIDPQVLADPSVSLDELAGTTAAA